MPKYDVIQLREHKARVSHICKFCGKKVGVGENVYYQSDKFLQSLLNKKFCKDCFEEYGQNLLDKKAVIKNTNQKTLFG